MNATQPETALDRLRVAVMADPAAQQALAEPYDPAEFEARALGFAKARGIPLRPADLRDPLAPGVRDDGAVPYDTWPSAAWLPVSLVGPDARAVDWAHFAGTKPDQPFFEDAQQDAVRRPFNRLFRYRTPIDAFLTPAREALAAPRGLIFHMSRCGSTLVSRMLAALPDNVVLSEPAPFDSVLQSALPPSSQGAALRAMAAALGRGCADYYLKTDAWHTLALPLLRETFPEVPWIFLYRDPVEVLVSHDRMPGRHVVPGVVPMLDGLAPGCWGAEHAARILARICEAVVVHGVAERGLLVHYRELPDALFTRILPHFGVTPSPGERALMAQAARQDAKAPRRQFVPDGADKQRGATEQVRHAARHLAPVYAELEAIRAASLQAAA